MLKLKLALPFLFFLLTKLCEAQLPVIEWQKTFGGTYNEEANSIIQTNDGGFVIAGYTESNSGDVSGNHSTASDFWIIKIDSTGVLQWQKCLGGSATERAYDIKRTSDNGFIIVGTASSDNGDVTGVHFHSPDYWIVKTDSACNIQWQKVYGGMEDETAREVYETTDGWYIIIGEGSSIDGDMFDNVHGTAYDYWVVKIDSIGDLQWQRAIGGYGDEWGLSVFQKSTGEYMIGGIVEGIDHDIQCANGGYDFDILQLDSLGSILSQKCLGGTLSDEFSQIYPALEGGYFVVGTTMSNDGDVSGLHGIMDIWLAKVDSMNFVKWQTCLGGNTWEFGSAIDQTLDHGVVVAGRTNSNDSILTSHGSYDFYVANIDSIGSVLWSKAFGGTNDDDAKTIIQCRDGGYLVAGYTESFNGDVTLNHGGRDFWVVKLAPLGLEVKPNELSNVFSVRFNDAKNLQLDFNSGIVEDIIVQLCDLGGRTILREKVKARIGMNVMSLKTQGLSPGLYFVYVFTNQDSFTKKLVRSW